MAAAVVRAEAGLPGPQPVGPFQRAREPGGHSLQEDLQGAVHQTDAAVVTAVRQIPPLRKWQASGDPPRGDIGDVCRPEDGVQQFGHQVCQGVPPSELGSLVSLVPLHRRLQHVIGDAVQARGLPIVQSLEGVEEFGPREIVVQALQGGPSPGLPVRCQGDGVEDGSGGVGSAG